MLCGGGLWELRVEGPLHSGRVDECVARVASIAQKTPCPLAPRVRAALIRVL